MVVLEWVANPVNDMFADSLLAVVLQAEAIETPRSIPKVTSSSDHKDYFKMCLIELLHDMFGEECVMASGENVFVSFGGEKLEKDLKMEEVDDDKKIAKVHLSTLDVECKNDPIFKQIVYTACTKLRQSLIPPDIPV